VASRDLGHPLAAARKGELTATVTATAAADGKQRRPVQHTRTIHRNWGYDPAVAVLVVAGDAAEALGKYLEVADLEGLRKKERLRELYRQHMAPSGAEELTPSRSTS